MLRIVSSIGIVLRAFRVSCGGTVPLASLDDDFSDLGDLDDLDDDSDPTIDATLEAEIAAEIGED